MIESCVMGPKTGPERQAGYQTNIPPTSVRESDELQREMGGVEEAETRD